MPKDFKKIAGMREIVSGFCWNSKCGKVIVGLKTKRYCNETCKQQAKRERQSQLAIKEQSA